MKEKLTFILKRIKEGRLQEMWAQTVWIYQYVRRYWPIMILYTLLGIISTLISLGTSLASRDLVDIITGYRAGELIRTFATMIGLAMSTNLLSRASDYASSYLSMKVDAEIKSDIFGKILVTDWESLTNYHTGDLLTRWGSDASNISSGVLNFIPSVVNYVFRFVSALAMVIYHDPSFVIFAFLGMPVSLMVSRKLMNRMVNNNKRSAAMGAAMSGFNQEAFSNIQTIKSFDLVGVYKRKLETLQKDYIDMRLSFQRMSMGTSILLSFVGMAVSYAAYGWGIYRVWSGAISYGSMTMFLGLSGTLTGTVHNLTSLIPTIISLTTSAGRLMDILEMPREDYSGDDAASAFLEAHREEGVGLELQDLDYAYRNGTRVFEGAALRAEPQEVVALVGPSGEGKTTMMRIILSLLRTEGGTAYLRSGEDRIPLSPSSRRLFSYVPQGNTMFSGTIAENMRSVKPDASDEEIVEALKKACAWDFVEKLPEGIHSPVKERGGGFSEGQAQRLSIARALLRRAPLLLLDEATSALDVATERRVLRNIMGDAYPRTCIVTTHRPTVLGVCSRVYAIQDRRCVVLTREEIEKMAGDF